MYLHNYFQTMFITIPFQVNFLDCWFAFASKSVSLSVTEEVSCIGRPYQKL